MGRIPDPLREIIARNIRGCRQKKFPGRGGGKKCAEAFGVSPQQWSPWERGMRTPDETRMEQLAAFFGVTVEFLRTDHAKPPVESAPQTRPHSLPPCLAPMPYTGTHDLLESVNRLLWLTLMLQADALTGKREFGTVADLIRQARYFIEQRMNGNHL